MWYFIIILASQCSASKQPMRIYGGVDAKPDEYSYIVRLEIQRHFLNTNNSISYKQKHLCTASALSPVWVLSAAHCIDDIGELYRGPPYIVEKLVIRHGHVEHLPGIHDSFSDVLFTIMNPHYICLESNDILKHDIGLLKTNPMNIKSYVKLSAVDYKSIYGHEAVLAGFGITSKKLPDGKTIISDTLYLKMPLQVLKVLITKCEESSIDLCLASRCNHESIACGGDSGGPLLHPSGLIGVISHGSASGYCLDSYEKKTNVVVCVVTPITPYIEWINKIIKS